MKLLRVGEGVSGWVVEFHPKGDHWIDFKAWQVVGWNGTSKEDGLLFGQNCDLTPDRTEENLVAKGYVKWDGCSEWDWPTDEWHLCGTDSVKERIELFKAVYQFAALYYPPSPMSDRLQW